MSLSSSIFRCVLSAALGASIIGCQDLNLASKDKCDSQDDCLDGYECDEGVCVKPDDSSDTGTADAGTDGEGQGQGEVDTDGDADVDTDGDTEVDTDGETDTDTDGGTDSESGAEYPTATTDSTNPFDTQEGVHTDTSTDTDTAAGAGTDTDSDPDAGTGLDLDAGSDTSQGSETDTLPDIGLEWIPMEAGSFMMGAEKDDPYAEACEMPGHDVDMPAFKILKTEVTAAQFEACVRVGACSDAHINFSSDLETCNYGLVERANHPMNCVNRTGAVEFCEWVGGRLPSEAEWEYAARSMGAANVFPWGDEWPDCNFLVETVGGEIPGCGVNHTWRVCAKTAGNTEQGLCDMAGNVLEWIADKYHDTYDGAPGDGGPWEDDEEEKFVLRGGGWRTGTGMERYFRTTYRVGDYPEDIYDTIGFRCSF